MGGRAELIGGCRPKSADGGMCVLLDQDWGWGGDLISGNSLLMHRQIFLFKKVPTSLLDDSYRPQYVGTVRKQGCQLQPDRIQHTDGYYHDYPHILRVEMVVLYVPVPAKW